MRKIKQDNSLYKNAFEFIHILSKRVGNYEESVI